MYFLFFIPSIRHAIFNAFRNITSDQIQAFSGMATVLITIIVFIQNQKIGTLKDVTRQLAKQAESTNALYRLSLRDLAIKYAPMLKDSSWDHANDKYTAKLVGNSAIFTEIIPINPKGVTISSSSLNMQKRLSNSVLFTIDGGDELSASGFAEFFVHYKSPLGLRYKQYFIVRKQPNYRGIAHTPKFMITFDYVILIEDDFEQSLD